MGLSGSNILLKIKFSERENMKNRLFCIVALLFSIMYVPVKAQAGWQELPALTGGELHAIEAVDTDRLLVGGWGGIWKMTSTGSDVAKVYDAMANIFDIEFINAQTGYAVGSVIGDGVILKSIDGGLHWQIMHRKQYAYFSSIRVRNANEIYVIYPRIGAGTLYRSIDGGATLDSIFATQELGLVTVGLSADNVFAISQGGAWRSSDSGLNWTGWAEPTGLTCFSNFANAANGNIFIAGQTLQPTYSFSANDGQDWTARMLTEERGVLNAVKFKGTRGYMVGTTCNEMGENRNGRIYRSDNNGDNWKLDYTLPEAVFYDIFIRDDLKAFAVGKNGRIAFYDPSPTGITPQGATASGYALQQNYPNPFNPTTTISFTIANTSFVELKVFDLLGKEVASVVSGVRVAGTYSEAFDASKLSSGIYFYTIRADGFTDTKRMMLFK